MIRIRPGRSWRHNPGYLGELRGLTAPRARSYSFSGILDVMGLEVDGVDIAAGVGEAPVLHTMGELLSALLLLGEGAGAAQATVGPGPTEVVLEARGPDVLLTLCTLRRPSRVLASGLLIDAARLRAAALQAAQGLLNDLLDISPALSGARLLKSLARSCAQLSRKPARPAVPWPSRAALATPGFVVRGVAKAKVACEVQVPSEAAARLAAGAEVPGAPLAALLGRGTLALRLPGSPALSLEGPPWLLLRDLLREANALTSAWEAGDRSFALHLGEVELACDLTTDEARAPAFSEAARASALQIASAIASTARAFAERALRLPQSAGPRPFPREDPLAELRTAADELLGHCRDLSSGDLRRAPEVVAAPAKRAPGALVSPLGHGRLRRLLHREVYREQLAAGLDGLWFWSGPGGAVLLGQRGVHLDARDGATGRPLWLRELGLAHAQGMPPAISDGDLVLESPEKDSSSALLRLELRGGALRFHRRMRGQAASLHPVPGGVVRALAGGAWSLVSGEGRVALRGSLPEVPLAVLAGSGVLLFCLPSGLVIGRGAQDGASLFRRKLGARIEAALVHGRALFCLISDSEEGESGPQRTVARMQLVGLEVASGDELFRVELPARAQPASLTVAGGSLALLCGESVVALRLRDGARRFEMALPWEAGASFLAPVEESDEHSPAARQLSRGPGLLATGPSGAALRLDDRGARLWSLDPSAPQPAMTPLVCRGVIALARDGLALYDATSGLPLSQLSQRPMSRVAVAPDLTVALLDEANVLTLHRLASHLSVV